MLSVARGRVASRTDTMGSSRRELSMVTTLILIVGGVLLAALAVIYFSLARRKRHCDEGESPTGRHGCLLPPSAAWQSRR